MADSFRKDRRIAALNTRYYELKAQSLQEETGVLIDFEEGMNAVEVRKCCDYFMKHTKASVVGVFCRKDEGDADGAASAEDIASYSYVIGSTNVDVRAQAKTFNALVNGRGGGQKEMIQGSLQASEETIRDAMNHTFEN